MSTLAEEILAYNRRYPGTRDQDVEVPAGVWERWVALAMGAQPSKPVPMAPNAYGWRHQCARCQTVSPPFERLADMEAFAKEHDETCTQARGEGANGRADDDLALRATEVEP